MGQVAVRVMAVAIGCGARADAPRLANGRQTNTPFAQTVIDQAPRRRRCRVHPIHRPHASTRPHWSPLRPVRACRQRRRRLEDPRQDHDRHRPDTWRAITCSSAPGPRLDRIQDREGRTRTIHGTVRKVRRTKETQFQQYFAYRCGERGTNRATGRSEEEAKDVLTHWRFHHPRCYYLIAPRKPITANPPEVYWKVGIVRFLGAVVGLLAALLVLTTNVEAMWKNRPADFYDGRNRRRSDAALERGATIRGKLDNELPNLSAGTRKLRDARPTASNVV